MSEFVSFNRDGQNLEIYLKGRIDSTSAPIVEKEILEEAHDVTSAVIDCADLEYLSSAGLRVILRLKKSVPNLSIINTSTSVYDIFQVTGFTEMINIRKAFRHISVKGCDIIGAGANGIVYRYDDETVVKVFRNPNALPEIEREQDLARTAFVLGVPTAISYDIVQVDDGLYGSVFELLNADSYHTLLLSGRKTIDDIAMMTAELLKIVHGTRPKPGKLPSKKDITIKQIGYIDQYLSPETFAKLKEMIEAIPENGHMLHADCHMKNVLVQNEESLLIDMDTLCVGDPIFEFSGLYSPYVGFDELDPGDSERFFGLPKGATKDLFNKILDIYCDHNQEQVDQLMTKLRIVTYARFLYYCAVDKHIHGEKIPVAVNFSVSKIEELLPTVEDLSSHIVY
ncbi:MAG: phosphotransferase [Solobacterium sp.]|nr:phosphotransferase [Solobacterium sp.]